MLKIPCYQGKDNLKQLWDTTTHLLEWPDSERWAPMRGSMWGHRNSHSPLVGTQTSAGILEDSWVASYKTKYIGILQSSNAVKKTSIEMYTAALSIVAQT